MKNFSITFDRLKMNHKSIYKRYDDDDDNMSKAIYRFCHYTFLSRRSIEWQIQYKQITMRTKRQRHRRWWWVEAITGMMTEIIQYNALG